MCHNYPLISIHQSNYPWPVVPLPALLGGVGSVNTCLIYVNQLILLDFSLTVKATTLIFISGCGSAIPSAKEGKSGFIYNLVKIK